MPASKTGSASTSPSGTSPESRRSRSCLRSGLAAAQASKPFCHSACSCAPRSTALRVCSMTSSATSLHSAELVCAECGAVDLAGVLLLGSRPADDRLEDDEGRLVRDLLGVDDGLVQLLHVLLVDAGLLPVDDLHVPVVGLVAGLDVLGEGDVGVVLDRDLVGVVDGDQVAELLVAGEAGGLGADALLQVAVAGDHVDEVVERAGARRGVRVEQAAFEALRVGEADGGGDALAERAGGDLDALGVAVLRVAGGERAPGAQRLEVVELEAVTAEVELDVLGQRAVAGRQDEAVASEPVLVVRVAAHHLLEEQVRSGCEAHRGAGMPVAHLLDRIGREDAHRVYCLVVNGIPLQSCHVKTDPS